MCVLPMHVSTILVCMVSYLSMQIYDKYVSRRCEDVTTKEEVRFEYHNMLYSVRIVCPIRCRRS